MTDDARAALVARQGDGARYDAASAPAETLAQARLGTAYFARLLNGLTDAALDAPATRDGWTRRMVIAETGYHARRVGLFIAAARAGETPNDPITPSPAEIANGATLPPRALRHLIEHAAVHLNVEWRDMTDADWDRTVNGTALRDTPMMRARLLWQNALDLNAGGRLRDVPEGVL